MALHTPPEEINGAFIIPASRCSHAPWMNWMSCLYFWNFSSYRGRISIQHKKNFSWERTAGMVPCYLSHEKSTWESDPACRLIPCTSLQSPEREKQPPLVLKPYLGGRFLKLTQLSCVVNEPNNKLSCGTAVSLSSLLCSHVERGQGFCCCCFVVVGFHLRLSPYWWIWGTGI